MFFDRENQRKWSAAGVLSDSREIVLTADLPNLYRSENNVNQKYPSVETYTENKDVKGADIMIYLLR